MPSFLCRLPLRIELAGLVATDDQLGVVVYDGVTELGLAGLIDPYLGTLSARTYAMAAERQIIPSQGGFQLLPRYTFQDVPRLDRVLIPAGESASARHAAAAAWSAHAPARPLMMLGAAVVFGVTHLRRPGPRARRFTFEVAANAGATAGR
jgi:hypothetical protein